MSFNLEALNDILSIQQIHIKHKFNIRILKHKYFVCILLICVQLSKIIDEYVFAYVQWYFMNGYKYTYIYLCVILIDMLFIKQKLVYGFCYDNYHTHNFYNFYEYSLIIFVI